MYYLGIDLGSSSVKLALVDAANGKNIGLVQEPEEEMSMLAVHQGWAEQEPEEWWRHVCNGIKKLKTTYQISSEDIKGIGIAYQMHGLVIIDEQGNCLRKSIIWCDSRAVGIGAEAYRQIGKETCDTHLLNAPANFTASKLKWVKDHEPEIYAKIHKFMLPGDYIAYKLSGSIGTTLSGLSEGIFWDFKAETISSDILRHYGFDTSMIPEIVPTFGLQAQISEKGAAETGLQKGTPILYRAGDQPNNALSLNVFNPGEIAATGGTSGVVYAVTNNLSVKEASRVNNFAHVNYEKNKNKNIGKLLCINGAGIQYRWLLNNLGVASYDEMNQLAATVDIGSDGVGIIPFGNGAERMLENIEVGTSVFNLNLNRHSKAHLCRAALEGIAFAFVYGIEIMKSDGISAKVMRAGNDNLFRSAIFSNTIATLTNQKIEIYDTTGAIGAARACALKNKDYDVFEKFTKNDYLKTFVPAEGDALEPYQKAYKRWKNELEIKLTKI